MQEPGTRELLLRTCVPDVLPPGLAEDLAGPHALRGLAELAGSNMFLEPVPGHPGTYRYLPFFRDLLRAQLAYEDPGSAADLHRRAAAWLRSREMPVRSVAQLATGGLWSDVATQLAEDLLVARMLLGRDERLLDMARRIPADVTDPAAHVVRAALALIGSDPATCAEELELARAAVGPAPDSPTGLSLRHRRLAPRLPGRRGRGGARRSWSRPPGAGGGTPPGRRARRSRARRACSRSPAP